MRRRDFLKLCSALPWSASLAPAVSQPAPAAGGWTLKGLRLWLAAMAGDPSAQCALGINYMLGEDAPLDEVRAMPWLHRASAAGDENAPFLLSWCYRKGHNVPEDRVLALTLLRQAAERHCWEAMLELAGRHLEGDGVPRDEAQAVHLIYLASLPPANMEMVLADPSIAPHAPGLRALGWVP